MIIKLKIFQFYQNTIFLYIIPYLILNFLLPLMRVFLINKDIIKRYKIQDIKLFCQNLDNIFFKTCKIIKKTKNINYDKNNEKICKKVFVFYHFFTMYIP